MWLFVALVLLAGGASRYDAMSLVFLRPLAILAAAFALISAPVGALRRMPFPFYLLLALMVVVALQLAPLPWDVWRVLPGRGLAATLAEHAGLPQSARPLSLTPARTWNSLFSLAIPCAAFLLYRVASPRARLTLIPALLLAGLATIVLGLLQSVADADSWLYTYRVHTEGAAVGLFANRNHQGVFLACVIVFATVFVALLKPTDKRAYLKLALTGGFVVLVVPFILVLGSRAGLLMGLVALALAPVLLFGSPLIKPMLTAGSRRGRQTRPWLSRKVLFIGAFAAAVTALAALAVRNSRGEALSRLSDSGQATPFDRSEVAHYLWQMAGDFFPWGAGFGSFDTVFHAYEPRAAISTFYLNHAHNDWLQLAIEGGLPALLLLGAFVAWIAVQAFVIVHRRGGAYWPVRLGMLAIVGIIAVASVVDYPLRVPIIMMLLVFAISILADDEVPLLTEQGSGRP